MGISMRCVSSMFDDFEVALSLDRGRARAIYAFKRGVCFHVSWTCLGVWFRVDAFSLDKGRARAMLAFQ